MTWQRLLATFSISCVMAQTKKATDADMVSLNIFNGRGSLSDAEVAMATPDDSEAKDLTVHVRRCALRFKLLAEGHNSLHGDVAQIKLILIGVGGYLVLVSQPAQNLIGKVMGILS